jgi:hypothetical protein
MTNSFPAHLAHLGVWEGTYRHFGADDVIESEYRSRVTCEFPGGGVFYRQTTELFSLDGSHSKASFDGIDRGDHLWFDAPTFFGKSWETGSGQILLDLERKDEPGGRFIEIIVMGDGGAHRARTWHWFRSGKLYRRTLCNESRVR